MPPAVKKISEKEAKALGLDLSQFPNFSGTGNVRGMRQHYYGPDALLVRSGGYVYLVDQATYDRIGG